MPGEHGSQGAEFDNGGDNNFEGFSFEEAGNLSQFGDVLRDTYGAPQEAGTERAETSLDRVASTGGDPVANWQDTRGAQDVSCDAYCRQVRAEHPSHVDSRANQVGYFGGGPSQEVQLTPRQQYQLRAQQQLQQRDWNRNNYVDRTGGQWNQGRVPVDAGGQTIVNIQRGGGNQQGRGWNGGWGNGWQNGNQGGDSTTIITDGGGQVSTGNDNIRLGDYEYDKSRTTVNGRVVAGNGRGTMDSGHPTYNDQTARQLGRLEGLNRVLGTVADHRDGGNNGGWDSNDPYASRRNRSYDYDPYANRRNRGGDGRNTTIIVNGGRQGGVFTGSDDINLGDFGYSKNRTHVGTPPFVPQGQGQRGPSYNGGGMDNRNPTYNDQTARELGTIEAGNRILGNVLRIFD